MSIKPIAFADTDDSSTASSDGCEEQEEFFVDRILAEAVTDDNEPIYLVCWEGYPAYDNTWEPRDSFLNQETFDDWIEEKKRVESGESQPFDVDAWLTQKEEWLQRKEAERRLQHEKRHQRKQSEARRAGLAALRDRRALSDHAEESVQDEVQPFGPPPEEVNVNERTEQRTLKRRIGSEDSNTALSKRRNTERVPTTGAILGSRTDISRLGEDAIQMPTTGSEGRSISGKHGIGKRPSDSSGFHQQKLIREDLWKKIKPARKAAPQGVGPAGHPSVGRPVVQSARILDNWDKVKPTRKRSSVPKQFYYPSQAWWAARKSNEERVPQKDSLILYKASDGPAVSQKPLRRVPRRSSKVEPDQHQKNALNHLHAPSMSAAKASLSTEKNKDVSSKTHSEDVMETLFLSPSPSPAQEIPPAAMQHAAQQTALETELTRNRDPNPHERQNEDLLLIDASEQFQPAQSLKEVLADASSEQPMLSELGQPTDILSTPDLARLTIDFGPNARRLENLEFDKGQHTRQVYGNLTFGEDRWPCIRTTFDGLPYPQWWAHFLRIKKEPKTVEVHITQLCTAAEYLREYHFGGQGYYAAGFIDHWKSKTPPHLEEILNKLRECNHGGLFFSEHYTLLLYDPECSDWSFLSKINPPKSSLLRFVLRSPHPSRNSSDFDQGKPSSFDLHKSSSKFAEKVDPVTVSFGHSTSLNPTDAPLLQKESNQSGTMAKEQTWTSAEMMFEQKFGLKWSDIMPTTGLDETSTEPLKFFLYYPLEAKPEHDFLQTFLRAGFNVKTYSMFEAGEWELFINPKNIPRGVVLFHASVKDFEKIRGLRHILGNGSIRIMQVDLRTHLPGSFAKNIFPSGACFLVPDSLVLGRPEVAVRLIVWFRRHKIPYMSNSRWKLVLRPGFRDWLRDIIQNKTSRRLPQQLQHFKDMLLQLAFAIPESDYDENDGYRTPLPRAAYSTPYTLPDYNYEVGTTIEDETSALESNDKVLAQWYGNWSLQQIDRHRRFYIIFEKTNLNSDSQIKEYWSKTWSHINVVSSHDFVSKEHVERDEANYNAKKTVQATKSPSAKSPSAKSPSAKSPH